VWADLVPNGVATITARYSADGLTTGRERQPAITVPVINNLAVWKLGTGATAPIALIWRAANGRVIRTIYMGL
jgi:hypothetical protein